MKLTTDALTLLAAEETIFPKSKDALDRLAFLVGPLFAHAESDRRITGQIASEIVESNFGLKLPLEVADAMLFRLSDLDFLKKEEVGESRVFFGGGEPRRSNGSSVIDELVKDFRLFVKDKKLLPKISDSEILDFFMAEVFKVSDVLGEISHQKDGQSSDKWKLTLISDYIIHHTSEDGTLPPLLTKLAELCLLRSVVGNMTSQRKRINNSTLIVILDAPIALFAIGASGEQQKKSIAATLDLVKSFGVRVTVLPTSIDEMKRVIGGTLLTDHRDRRGLTAAAIRRGELTEIIAGDMRSNPEKYAKSAGITVLPRGLTTFKQDEHFFPEKDYQEFSATASTWANTLKGEYHDAECLAVTMRSRKGKHERNLFSNDYVFVTNNWKFSVSARRRCLELLMTNVDACPAVIHMNTFAASVWLAGGFEHDSKIPERTLLAACERTLSGHEGIMEKTRETLGRLSLVDDATIELLMMDRDSVNAIVSHTGNDPSLVNEENIVVLLTAAKAAIAQEVSSKAKADIIKLEGEYEDRLNVEKLASQHELNIIRDEFGTFKQDIEAQIHEREQRIVDLELTQELERQSTRKSVNDRVENINGRITSHGWGSFEWFGTCFFVVASTLTVFQVSLYTGIALSIFGVAFITLSFFGVSFPKNFKTSIIRRYATRQIRLEFSSFEIEKWRISVNPEALVVMND